MSIGSLKFEQNPCHRPFARVGQALQRLNEAAEKAKQEALRCFQEHPGVVAFSIATGPEDRFTSEMQPGAPVSL